MKSIVLLPHIHLQFIPQQISPSGLPWVSSSTISPLFSHPLPCFRKPAPSPLSSPASLPSSYTSASILTRSGVRGDFSPPPLFSQARSELFCIACSPLLLTPLLPLFIYLGSSASPLGSGIVSMFSDLEQQGADKISA